MPKSKKLFVASLVLHMKRVNSTKKPHLQGDFSENLFRKMITFFFAYMHVFFRELSFSER